MRKRQLQATVVPLPYTT